MLALENSVAEFVERWKSRAAPAIVYPQPEGSPLLEVCLGGRVVYLMDRTGPYVARPGGAWVIIHPVTGTMSGSGEGAGSGDPEERLQVTGVSSVQATGTVLEVTRGIVVVQARAPLVVGVFDDSWRQVRPGEVVSFESLEPVHGFYVGTRGLTGTSL